MQEEDRKHNEARETRQLVQIQRMFQLYATGNTWGKQTSEGQNKKEETDTTVDARQIEERIEKNHMNMLIHDRHLTLIGQSICAELQAEN